MQSAMRYPMGSAVSKALRLSHEASITLTWMEAATGQLYLAILIARLVGLHLVHRRGEG